MLKVLKYFVIKENTINLQWDVVSNEEKAVAVPFLIIMTIICLLPSLKAIVTVLYNFAAIIPAYKE